MTQRTTLGSSAIEAVTYNATNRTLDVEFREGHSYRYLYVPEFVYQALLKAESAGRFGNPLRIDSIT